MVISAAVAGLIGAGISGIGSVGSAGLGLLGSSISSSRQYKHQLALQLQAQQWQTQMANTAHQREVKDMRAAGLNPILSATGGNGAAVGSVGQGSAAEPSMDLVGSALAFQQMKNRSCHCIVLVRRKINCRILS